MAENFIANIKSKLGELRKEYLPSQKETKEKEEKERQEKEKRLVAIQEKMRLDEERKVRDEEERKRQEEEKEMQRYCEKIEAKYSAEIKREAREKQKKEKLEKKMCEKEKREEERIKSEKERWFSQMKEGASVKNLKVFNQKQLAVEKLSILKKDYVCLIQQRNQLPKEKHKLNIELNNLRLKKQESYSDVGKQIIEEKIKGIQAKIKTISFKILKSERLISKKLKITESKIEQLKNLLSSDKFKTDQEIKKKLIKEEKDKLRIDRLRGEARKELFEKEFQAIPEDEKIRFISDEVKEFVWRRDQAKCVKCGSQDSLEFDHIIPFSKGGSNTARNIQLLCEKCNRSKHDHI